MIEHLPWVGEHADVGIAGQRIALMGYSHHDDGDDDEQFTVETIEALIHEPAKRTLGNLRLISRYFSDQGYISADTFWQHVTFFNFLPSLVGRSSERYRHGTETQGELGRARMLRIIEQTKPQALLIFTSRDWQLPPTLEQSEGRSQLSFGLAPTFWRGTYILGDESPVRAYKLRHPQGALGNTMRHAVRTIMGEAA